MSLFSRKKSILPKRLPALVAVFMFAAVGAYIVISSHAATYPPCSPYCHESLKTGIANYLQGPDWFNQDLRGNNVAGISYGSSQGDDGLGLETSRLVVLAFSDWRLIDTIPNYKVGTIVEFKVWLYGHKLGGVNDIRTDRAVQFGSIEKLTHLGAGDVVRDPSMIEVLGSDFENQCFKAFSDPARIHGNQYYIGTFKIKILHEVARTVPGDTGSPSRTWALNIPHYVTDGSLQCSSTEKHRNIVAPAECGMQVSETCSPIDAPGVGPGAGPDGPGTGPTGTGPGGGGGGSSAKKQSTDPNSAPSSTTQGDNKQPELEASPFFDGKQYEPGSDPDLLGVNTTFSVAGHNLKYGWVYVLVILVAGGIGYCIWKRPKFLARLRLPGFKLK